MVVMKDARTLAQDGRIMNAPLAQNLLEYCKGKPTLLQMISWSVLKCANNVDDDERKLMLLQFLTKPTDQDDIQKINVRRLAPVVRAVQVFGQMFAEGFPTDPDLPALLAMQQYKIKNKLLSWSTLMPDKALAMVKFQYAATEMHPDINELDMPFGSAVQQAYCAYTGVKIVGQPHTMHHFYLHRFEATWARAAREMSPGSNYSVLDVNSGLYIAAVPTWNNNCCRRNSDTAQLTLQLQP